MAQLTKRVLEVALEAEMAEHLGYEAHDPEGRNGRNSRNGRRSKRVLTGVGPVEVAVPRDRDGSFEPVIVKKRQRRLDSVDQIVSSLTAKGLTTGEISAHVAEIYGASVGKDEVFQVSQITDAVIAEMGRMAEPAPGPRLPGRVRGRDHGQDPRRQSHQPARLRRDRRHDQR